MNGTVKILLSIIGGLLIVVITMLGGLLKWYVNTTGESNSRQWRMITDIEGRVIALETKGRKCK